MMSERRRTTVTHVEQNHPLDVSGLFLGVMPSEQEKRPELVYASEY